MTSAMPECPLCGESAPHRHMNFSWGRPNPEDPIEAVTITVTRAERRVLHELCRDGATNEMLVHRLDIKLDTVKSHLSSVMRQLPMVTSRTELAVGLIRGYIRTVTVRQRTNAGVFVKGQPKGTKLGQVNAA